MPKSSPFPEPIWRTLPEALRLEILNHSKDKGAYETATIYFKKTGMTKMGLYRRLLKMGREDLSPRTSQARRAVKLTKNEREFLEELREGTKGIEDIARIVAVKVFEKMLKYPDDFKFYDFYQSQILKLKKEEQANKKTVMETLINQMFAGKLPPTHCPKCGTEIIHVSEVHEIEEGEIIT
jgi:hypothetical protein